jgi:hypothetical protein
MAKLAVSGILGESTGFVQNGGCEFLVVDNDRVFINDLDARTTAAGPPNHEVLLLFSRRNAVKNPQFPIQGNSIFFH